jgi:hypothetical protein
MALAWPRQSRRLAMLLVAIFGVEKKEASPSMMLVGVGGRDVVRWDVDPGSCRLESLARHWGSHVTSVLDFASTLL